jgi:tetratricopeptide (TPR) repeat protein
MAKEMGDRAGEGTAYGNLGIAYRSQGDFSKAIEYQTQHLAIAKEVGDRAGEGAAYGNLGNTCQSQGDVSKAIEYQTQCLAIAKEVGDRAGEGAAYANLGNAYQSERDVSKAIEHHAQHLAIAKEVGDRAGEGAAYGNLGNAYRSQENFSQAIEHQTQCLAIAKEVGDRAGEGRAYGNLGTCHMHLNDYVKAAACFEAQHVMATSLKLAHEQCHAALYMGVTLTLRVRAARQGTAAGADQSPGPHSHSSAYWAVRVGRCPPAGVPLHCPPRARLPAEAPSTPARVMPSGGPHRSTATIFRSACLEDRVREAAKWLQAAFDGGHAFAKLHLAHLTFEAGQEDAALAHLKEHLSWLVQRGRDTCAGCGQTRTEDTPMLTCGGCRVARFCSADHQRMASTRAAFGRSPLTGRHKDICRVLRKWREVVKGGVSPDSCTADLVAFLQR